MRELQQFVEVAGRRSISGAAKALNISQPALSRAIAKLEERYGAPLFIRTGAGVELSPYGSLLYSRAVRILPALDAAQDEIRQMQSRTKVLIRIACGDLWGIVVLPEVIRRFAMTHPDVVVHMEITDEGTRQEGLQNGAYDLVFGTLSERYGPIVQTEFEPMLHQATYIYCDEANPLASRSDASIDELLQHRWISLGIEDDAGPGPLAGYARDFAVRVDTTMNAALLLQNSRFLMAASSGFVRLFRRLGIGTVQVADRGPSQPSGAMFPSRSINRPPVADFLGSTREQIALLQMPVLERFDHPHSLQR